MNDFTPNANTIRLLNARLPYEVFDYICEYFPELLCRPTWVVDYINAEGINESYSPDRVAEDYGYESYDDMKENGKYFVTIVDDSYVLIME